MSLLDDLASADVDLDNLRLGDLGIDIMSLGWTETEEGILSEVVRENDKFSMNREEVECFYTIESTRNGLARLYVCKQGSNTWQYNGLYGAAAIVTEADLRMACAHYIRLVDLGGFNPNSSLILQQELYKGMKYNKANAWFHTFEMSHYIVGLSFSKEEAAEIFYENVQHCLTTEARDVVEDDVDSKEKTYLMVGESNWRTVNEGMSANVAKKYAGGGITDGTEVMWNKKPNLPPALAEALGMAGISSPDIGLKELPQKKESSHIDLLRNSRIRSKSVCTDNKIHDGVTMQWSKNQTTLTGDNAKKELLKREAALKNKKKGKKILGVKFGKKK